MFGIPSNVLPLFVMGLVVLIFGLRGLVHYYKVKTPLTYYYALTGISFGLSGLFYSLPFVLTDQSDVLKLTVTIADILFYIGLIIQMRIIWYLGLKKSISFAWLLVPTLVISLISLSFDIHDRLQTTYYVADGVAHFPTATVSLYILALLSLSIIVVGVLTLLQVRTLTDASQRVRLTTLGAMFVLAGLTIEYNFLFLQGSNTSPAILVGYAIAIVGFVVGLFFVGRKRT